MTPHGKAAISVRWACSCCPEVPVKTWALSNFAGTGRAAGSGKGGKGRGKGKGGKR